MVRSADSMTMKNNQEEIFDALTDFERRPSKEIPPVLEQFLRDVAQTGETLFPWARVKVLFKWKLEQVMTDFNEDSPTDHLPSFPNVENVKFEEYRRRILAAVEKFQGVPFTIQRLCELITEPRKHYKRSDKFLRGIEKNVLVVSTVDPLGRREVSESKVLVNGLDTNGCSPQADRSEEEDHTVPETHALVEVHSENNAESVSTKWPMSIAAISVPSPSITSSAATALAATSSAAPLPSSSPASQADSQHCSSPPSQQTAPSEPAAQAAAEAEAKADSAANGQQPPAEEEDEDEEMGEREVVSAETDSQSSSSDDSLPATAAGVSQAADLCSSNSEAEETHPAGCRGHSDQDSSITTSDGMGDISMQWPGHSMTVNNSAEASACPAAPSPPPASSGPPSEVTISTSNSSSPSRDATDLSPADKSNNAESEAEARPASPMADLEREDSSQGEHSPECGRGQQQPQQCEVDSSEATETDSNGQPKPGPEEAAVACPSRNGDLTDSPVAVVSVSSSDLAEQAEQLAQAPAALAAAAVAAAEEEDKEVEMPAEAGMEQEQQEQGQQQQQQEEAQQQQEPTQSEEEPMEQD